MKIFALIALATLLPLAACDQARASASASAAPAAATAPATPPLIPIGTKMKCPVSGDPFTVDAKTQQVVYQGKRYAFCCPDCLPEFNKHPEKFAK